MIGVSQEELQAAANTVVEMFMDMVPGWDGPVPTNDNFHDLADANMVLYEAAEHLLSGRSVDEEYEILNAVHLLALSDPRVDRDAESEFVVMFYRAAWGRNPHWGL